MHQRRGVDGNLLGQHVIAPRLPYASWGQVSRIPRSLRELNRRVGDFTPTQAVQAP